MMEAAVLHGYGHDQAGHKHHIGALNTHGVTCHDSHVPHLEVVPGHLVSAGHPGQGEEHQGQQGGDGEREQLEYPEHGHDLQRAS